MNEPTEAGIAEVPVAEISDTGHPSGEITHLTWWERNEPIVLGMGFIVVFLRNMIGLAQLLIAAWVFATRIEPSESARELWQRYADLALPITMILNGDGIVQDTHVGEMSYDELAASVDAGGDHCIDPVSHRFFGMPNRTAD